MNLQALALGILLGTAVFGAFFWSAAQGYLQTGRLRAAHLMLVAFTLLGMASISLLWPGVARFAGAGLIVTGLYATIVEKRWNRVLTLAQAAFGLTLVAGLPFR
ncbi:MAG: hypothetical protein ACPGID_07070 [Rubricella sp.]